MERDFSIKTRKYTGVHSDRYHPEHVFQYITEPDEHGFRKAIVGNARRIKRDESTLYPAAWDEKTIGQKVIEGLLTAEAPEILDGTIKIKGIAQNYIPNEGICKFKIEIYLSPEGIIKSNWPIFSNR